MSIQDRPSLVLHATFVLTGIVTTLLGPTLPILVSWWALDDTRAGLLFAAQFVGSMLGSAMSSVGMTRVGFRRTLVAGVVSMAAGVAALGAGDRAAGTAAIFVYGVGLGLTIPTTNLFVARAYSAGSASALSVLNFAWGIGAVGAPTVVALFQRVDAVRVLLFGLAAALLMIAAPVARIAEPDRGKADGEPIPGERPAGAARHAATWAFGSLLFLYVGTETSVAGWVALYASRLDIVPAMLSVATPSLFWGALLAGRAIAPIVLRRVADARLLGASLLVATAGVAALAAARSPSVLALSIVVGGLGMSAVFPVAFALFARDLGRGAARSAGPVFVLAGLGGAVLPPLVGLVSTMSGSLSTGLAVPLAGCVAMIALRAWQARAAAAPVRMPRV